MAADQQLERRQVPLLDPLDELLVRGGPLPPPTLFAGAGAGISPRMIFMMIDEAERATAI